MGEINVDEFFPVKRFSETLKWADPWFQKLPGHQKLLFLYVIDCCDNAGFLEINDDIICMHTGLNHKHLEGAWEGLGRGLIRVDGWVWARTFLKNQKNWPLNFNNPAHIGILRLINAQRERFSKVSEFNALKAPKEGLVSPLGRGIGKGKKKRVWEKKQKPTRELVAGIDYIKPDFGLGTNGA